MNPGYRDIQYRLPSRRLCLTEDFRVVSEERESLLSVVKSYWEVTVLVIFRVFALFVPWFIRDFSCERMLCSWLRSPVSQWNTLKSIVVRSGNYVDKVTTRVQTLNGVFTTLITNCTPNVYLKSLICLSVYTLNTYYSQLSEISSFVSLILIFFTIQKEKKIIEEHENNNQNRGQASQKRI